jgi:poly-gamma-glutamate capsule biosynthesis protein CapA/YwtB (metallophosphatase superfamily)
MKTLFSLMLAALMCFNAAYAGEFITVAAVGDIMMGTDHPEDLLPPNGGEGIFNSVTGLLKGQDLVIGNLEGPLIDGGTPAKCAETGRNCYEFRTPVSFVRRLKEAGFNAMSIANNHAFDFGPEGVKSTIKALGSAGIGAAGGRETALIEAKGKRVAVAGFSFTASPYSHDLNDIQKASEVVRKLGGTHDIVIVSFHGGAEGKDALHVAGKETFLGEERGDVVAFAHAAIDAGADMVIGHGPHVPRAVEIYKGKLIAYSLGNFLTYERFNISGPNGLSVILRARMDSTTGDFAGGELVPVRIMGKGIPEPDPMGGAVKLIKELTAQDIPSPNIRITAGGELRMDENAGADRARAEL